MDAAPPQVTEVEKRDALGRLVARVRLVNGVVDGECLFYAEDGETVVARCVLRHGVPVAAEAPPRLLTLPGGVPGDAAF